jgi:hypothetical protein
VVAKKKMVLVYERGAEFVFGVLGRAYTALSLFACVFLFIVEAAHLHYQMQIIIISGPVGVPDGLYAGLYNTRCESSYRLKLPCFIIIFHTSP